MTERCSDLLLGGTCLLRESSRFVQEPCCDGESTPPGACWGACMCIRRLATRDMSHSGTLSEGIGDAG